MTFVERIVRYMMDQKYLIFTNEGEMNIVYVEDVNFEGQPIRDLADRFNDPRIIFTFKNGKPEIVHIEEATCEPGRKPTLSLAARRRGGVFRVKHGQYIETWVDGFHKGKTDHPALIHLSDKQVWGYRDLNMDGLRTNDKLSLGWGINHHGTSPWYRNIFVGDFSEGCGVGQFWGKHLKFVETYRSDIRYQRDKNFRFTVTYIAGDDLNRRYPA